MTIQRFETGPRMSQVVVHGNTVYLAGVVAGKAAGKSVTEQTQDILAIIDGHLAKAGTDKSKLLSATIYITDMKTFPDMPMPNQKMVRGIQATAGMGRIISKRGRAKPSMV